jgi:hypothetical protein
MKASASHSSKRSQSRRPPGRRRTEAVRTRPIRAASGIQADAAPLTVDDLETGLRKLDHIDTDRKEFWAANGRAFEETVRFAIRETSEALLLQRMSATLRTELEGQLEWLKSYLDQQNCLARQSSRSFLAGGNCQGAGSAFN